MGKQVLSLQIAELEIIKTTNMYVIQINKWLETVFTSSSLSYPSYAHKNVIILHYGNPYQLKGLSQSLPPPFVYQEGAVSNPGSG